MLKVARGLLAFSWNNKVAKRPSVKATVGGSSALSMILTKSDIRVYQFPILIPDTLKFEYNFLILFRRGKGTFLRRIYDSIICKK